MSDKPKYLKNTKTGVVFPATDLLLKNGKDLIPCRKDGSSFFEEVDATGHDPEYLNPGDTEPDESEDVEAFDFIETANKPELIKFAKDNFGEEIPTRTPADEVRQRVRDLMDEA